jgi:tetratricopeptide (TPR) repeat protein
LRLAAAGLWGRRGGPGAAAALARLEQGREEFSAEDQDRLLGGLAQAYLQIGAAAESRALFTELARRQPHNLSVRLVLFDLALEKGDEPALAAVVEELRKIEGDAGTLWRYGLARDRINRAWKGEQQNLGQIGELLEAVAKRRPSWSRVHVALAELDELRGRQAAALEKYRHAVMALGEGNPAVLRHFLELLAAGGRWGEATAILRQMPADGLPGMERLMADLWRQAGDTTRALNLARKAVADNSKDYRDLIWLGRLLWAAGRDEEGVKYLLRATEVAEAVPDPWVALVQVLALTGRQDEARRRIAQARRKLPPGKSDLALAQCHEAVGDRKEARQLYQSALAAAPDDPAALRGYVDFCLRYGDSAEAMPLLDRLGKLKGDAEDAAWARRMLALLLALSGDEARARQALSLLGLTDAAALRPAAEDSLADLHTKAVVLERSGGRAHLAAAIQFREEAVRRSPGASDLSALLELYDKVYDNAEARQQALRGLHRLLARHAGEASSYEALSHYALALLKRGEAREAAEWVDTLEAQRPDDLRTLELRCRFLVLRKDAERAVALVRQRAEKAKGPELGQLADLLEELGQVAPAEELLRRWLAQPKAPEAGLALAQFLGRRGRLHEALDLCDKARPAVPMPAVADVALALLYGTAADAAERARVGGWLEQAIRKTQRKADLRASLALLRNLEGRYDEAVELYRQVLAEDNQHVVALNNLAWLLAVRQHKPDEALVLLARAEEIKGAAPDLLDTRAVVYLSQGEGGRAIKLLEQAAADRPSAATLFHLARAHQLAHDPAAARMALDRAREMGLSPAKVHPLERPALEQMLAELGTN